MEQSEYLKNLMRRLEEASEVYHDPHDPTNPHSISTIKFEREELDSNYNHSKRDPYLTAEAHNETRPHAGREERAEALEGLVDAIDNTKTSRNSPALKFNPAKVRKRSEDKFDRELSRRSGSSRREKGDLVEVRDRLVDIISFLNAKIDNNPEVGIKKVVDLDFVKESLLPSQPEPHRISREAEGSKGSLLYLPKFQLHDAKLVKSSEILNNLSQEHGKTDNQYLNLKHSFDKLNDIHSSHSLHQERSRNQPHQPQKQQPFYRQNAHIQQFSRPIPLQPSSLSQNQSKPLIFINGRLNSNSQSKINFQPAVKQIRPFSEVPVIRYLHYSQLDPNSPQNSNSLSKISLQNTPVLPIGQKSKPFVHPPALNLERPPTFRTITSRPLSTQRLPVPPQPVRFGLHSPKFQPAHLQTQKIGLSSRIVQQELAQTPKIRPQQAPSSRLKKKVNSSQLFKQDPLPDAQTPKKLLTEPNDNREHLLKVEEELERIAPPKPYTKFSSTTENPFKASEPVISVSKKSQKFKADISYDILRSIAEQSEENQPSRNLEASGRSSGRMMSSVREVTPASELPQLSKFLGSGSTKLKRKGIDVSSSKKGYMSQYTRQ